MIYFGHFIVAYRKHETSRSACLCWVRGQVLNYNAHSAGTVEFTDCTSAVLNTLPPNECPGYDTKQTDGEVPVMLGLWGMQSSPSLPLFPGTLWPRMVAPDRALSMGEIELTAYLC